MPARDWWRVLLTLWLPFASQGVAAGSCTSLMTFHTWSQYLQCLQTACINMPVICEYFTRCDAEVNNDLYGIGSWFPNGTADFHFKVWQLCPKSCGMCRAGDVLNMTAVEAAVGQPCESGWEYISGACLKHFVEGWYVRKSAVTWYDAQDRCRQVGAELANVDVASRRHMALELVRRRPRRLHSFAAMAWVSWPDGYAAVGGGESSNSSDSVASPRAWLNTFDNKGFLPSIESFRVDARQGQMSDEDFDWYLAQIHGWVCSKPAKFREIESGSCEKAGLRTIESAQECEAAARLLGLVDAVALTYSGLDPWYAGRTLPAGCYYSAVYARSYVWYGGSYLVLQRGNGTSGDGSFNGSDLGAIQICIPALPVESDWNVSIIAGQMANASKVDETQTHEVTAKTAGEDQASNVAFLLYFCCITSYCTVVLVAVLSRKWIKNACCHFLDFLRSVSRFLTMLRSRRDKSAAEALVELTMRSRRTAFACFMAVVILTFHLYWIMLLAWEPMAPCGGQGIAAEAEILKVMVGHFAQILTMAVFLGLQATEMCTGRWAIRVLAAATMSERFIQEAILGGHPIFLQRKSWYELLWRVLVGASLDVPSMAGLITIRSAGSILLYASTIPDNMIPVRLTTTCTELWSLDFTMKTSQDLAWIEGTLDVLRSSGAGDFVTELKVMLRWFASESTSLQAFATIEVVQCLALTLCLAALGRAMAEEIRATAKIRSSQSTSVAVSSILDRLCDAVVTIDPLLVITKPAPRLASLLAAAPRTPLEGTDLRRRLLPEDAETLTACLGGGEEEAGCPSEPLALSLVDSLNIRVPCEFFVAEFRDDGMARNFVVGINEVGERAKEGAAGTAGPSALIHNGLELPPLMEHVLEQSSDSSGSSQDLASSVGSQSECASDKGESLAVDFKYLSGDIVAASPGFNALLCSNTCIGTSIGDILSSKDKKHFYQWLQTTAAGFQSKPLPQVAVSEPIELKLPLVGNARNQRRKHRRQWATLAVTFPEQPVPETASEAPSDTLKRYVLSMEIAKVSGPPRRSTAGSETGSLNGEPEPHVLGRSFVGL